MKSIAIVGGGASGLAAAISAARILKSNDIHSDIFILEKLDRVGKKILATGNGRCNFTNTNANISFYHSQDIDFVDSMLKQFSPYDTIKFFESMGILIRTENDGRVYPYSNQASTVLDILRIEMQRLHIKEICNFEVVNIKKYKNKFIIFDRGGSKKTADKVIVSTGGCAYPALGSNGDGYRILKKLGHNCTKVYPALVQLKVDSPFLKALNGIRVTATAELFIDCKSVKKERGELQFTSYGLSGILILQLSTVLARYVSKNVQVAIDLLPDLKYEYVLNILNQRVKYNHLETVENFLVGIFNKRVCQMLLKSSGITNLSKSVSNLSVAEIKNIARNIKQWRFKVIGTMDWKNAQVTSGGIYTSEIDRFTLESKFIKNLYLTGELIDVDGDCGGFNLQWAWSTGFVAGKSAVLT